MKKNPKQKQVESTASGRRLCTAERLACDLITCLCALIGSWGGLATHLRRGLPKGEFSQVASLGGLTPHCESECSAKTKLSTGS